MLAHDLPSAPECHQPHETGEQEKGRGWEGNGGKVSTCDNATLIALENLIVAGPSDRECGIIIICVLLLEVERKIRCAHVKKGAGSDTA